MLFQPDLPDFVFSLQILYQLFTIHSTNIYFVSTRLSWFYRISCIYLIILIQPDFFDFKLVHLQICSASNFFKFKFLQIQISSTSDVQNFAFLYRKPFVIFIPSININLIQVFLAWLSFSLSYFLTFRKMSHNHMQLGWITIMLQL